MPVSFEEVDVSFVDEVWRYSLHATLGTAMEESPKVMTISGSGSGALMAGATTFEADMWEVSAEGSQDGSAKEGGALYRGPGRKVSKRNRALERIAS